MSKRYAFQFFFFVAVCCFAACVSKDPAVNVIDYSGKEAREAFVALNLDSIYTNLLGSEETEEEADSLYQDWLKFNEELASMIRDKNFDWGTEDSSIVLWNRVYCDGDGKINYYLYYIRDSLANNAAKDRYATFIKENISTLKYPVKRDFKYAQCGSYRHKNY